MCCISATNQPALSAHRPVCMPTALNLMTARAEYRRPPSGDSLATNIGVGPCSDISPSSNIFFQSSDFGGGSLSSGISSEGFSQVFRLATGTLSSEYSNFWGGSPPVEGARLAQCPYAHPLLGPRGVLVLLFAPPSPEQYAYTSDTLTVPFRTFLLRHPSSAMHCKTCSTVCCRCCTATSCIP